MRTWRGWLGSVDVFELRCWKSPLNIWVGSFVSQGWTDLSWLFNDVGKVHWEDSQESKTNGLVQKSTHWTINPNQSNLETRASRLKWSYLRHIWRPSSLQKAIMPEKMEEREEDSQVESLSYGGDRLGDLKEQIKDRLSCRKSILIVTSSQKHLDASETI